MSASKYLFAQFYDLLNSCVERKVIPYREQTASRCVGNTLEIGAGTGANIPFYKNVTSLSLVEPDKHMRSKLISKFPNKNETGKRKSNILNQKNGMNLF